MFWNYNGSCGYFIVFYNCFYFSPWFSNRLICSNRDANLNYIPVIPYFEDIRLTLG